MQSTCQSAGGSQWSDTLLLPVMSARAKRRTYGYRISKLYSWRLVSKAQVSVLEGMGIISNSNHYLSYYNTIETMHGITYNSLQYQPGLTEHASTVEALPLLFIRQVHEAVLCAAGHRVAVCMEVTGKDVLFHSVGSSEFADEAKNTSNAEKSWTRTAGTNANYCKGSAATPREPAPAASRWRLRACSGAMRCLPLEQASAGPTFATLLSLLYFLYTSSSNEPAARTMEIAL
eukprot:scaffold100687_cov39-Prasinocladus_malaysianus.AAC.1